MNKKIANKDGYNDKNEELLINDYKVSEYKNYFRKSALTRIIIGTASTTFVSVLYALAHAKYRKYEFSFVKNWLKGSLIFSSLFYSGNEILFSLTKFYGLYTNYWINYTLSAYILSKTFYRYLIRNHIKKWYEAIQYSHKCFLYLLVINLTIESFIFITKEIYLYNEPDLFDLLREKYVDKETQLPNFEMTFHEIQENFMSPYHVFNSKEKKKKIKDYIKDKREKDEKSGIKNKGYGIQTINLYDMYKNNKF